jgi:PleD family two-component response regulator
MANHDDNKNKKKKKILLVDDEPDIIYSIRRVLEINGFMVVLRLLILPLPLPQCLFS